MEEILVAKASALKVEVPESEVETAFTQAKANLTRRSLSAGADASAT